jgi:uncharacterized protein
MRFSVRHSPIHGRGVFARVAIAEGERVMEYRGERITPAQAHARYGDNSAAGHTFLFAPNQDWLIDGAKLGNSARWLNHSCAPNCEAVIFVDINGEEWRDKVWIYSLRAIAPNEELTFDYAIELQSSDGAKHHDQWRCRCGAVSCRGTLLAAET